MESKNYDPDKEFSDPEDQDVCEQIIQAGRYTPYQEEDDNNEEK